MFTFLLIIQTLVAAALVTVILMQRSEGGGLGVGGSSSGLMTARGAADFLTRATAILATLFVVLSIALAGLAAVNRAPTQIDPSLARQQPAGPSPLQPGGVPLADDPLAGVAATAGNAVAPLPLRAPGTNPAPAPSAPPAARVTRAPTAPAPKASATPPAVAPVTPAPAATTPAPATTPPATEPATPQQ